MMSKESLEEPSLITPEVIEHSYQENNLFFINYALTLCKDRDIADEMVSEAYSKLLTEGPFFAKEGVTKYITRVIRNHYLDFRKSPKNRNLVYARTREEQSLLEELIEETKSPDEIMEDESEKDLRVSIMNKALRKINPTYLEAFRYKIQEGKSIKDIVKILGIKEGAVKMRLSRSYQQLQRELRRLGVRWNGQFPITHGENIVRKKRKSA